MPESRRCRCPQPTESPNPRSSGCCARCGHPIGEDVLSTDKTVKAFFDRLEAAFPGAAPETFRAFRVQCEGREQTGREQFGLGYLSRDNCAESREEAADLGIYMHLEVLRLLRAGSTDGLDLALTAAFHAYKAYDATCRLAAKRRGTP